MLFLQDLKGEIPFTKGRGIFPNVYRDNVLRKETDPKKCTAVCIAPKQSQSDMDTRHDFALLYQVCC